MLKRIITSVLLLLFIIFMVQLLYPSAGRVAQTKLSKLFDTETRQSALSQITPAEFTQPENGVTKTSATTPASKSNPISGVDVVDATNKARVMIGLAPLRVNTLLTTSASAKNVDMILKQYFEHTSPTGEGVADLGAKAGYKYISMGENLALGDFTSANDLLNAWMQSPGHRANILNPLYQEIGVSVQRANYKGTVVWFAVQHFGTSREACPSISESLKESIDTIKKALAKKEKDIADLREEIESSESTSTKEYQDLVDEFNSEVTDYNERLTKLKSRISNFNTQVSEFNDCLSLYQKK